MGANNGLKFSAHEKNHAGLKKSIVMGSFVFFTGTAINRKSKLVFEKDKTNLDTDLTMSNENIDASRSDIFIEAQRCH